MTKFCPFMSKNGSYSGASTNNCSDKCALYWKGFCSINILAQKAIRDVEKDKKDKSVSK